MKKYNVYAERPTVEDAREWILARGEKTLCVMFVLPDLGGSVKYAVATRKSLAGRDLVDRFGFGWAGTYGRGITLEQMAEDAEAARKCCAL